MGDDEHHLLLVRHRRWFKPHVAVDELAPFPVDQIDVLNVTRPGTWGAKFLIGRGPVEVQLADSYRVYFEHGEETYPIFTVPSIGPRGAALMGGQRSRTIGAAEDEALFLVDAAGLVEVPDDFANGGSTPPSLDAFVDPRTSHGHFAFEKLSQLEYTTALLAGSYSLYQYPLVWTPLDSDRLVALVAIQPGEVALAEGSFHVDAKYVETPDNWIPFRLNPASEVSEGRMTDGVASSWATLANTDRLGAALVGLGEAMHQSQVSSRFLQLFWVLDLLAAGSGEVDLDFRKAVDDLGRFITADHPEFSDTWRRMKERSLQPSARARIAAYAAHMGVETDEVLVRRMVSIRNDLSHGRRPNPYELADVEREVRWRVWELLKAELATSGIELAVAEGADRSSPP